LLAAGYTEKEVAQMARSGRLSVVRPGMYLSGSPPADAVVAHGLAARAASGVVAERAALSHVSAAVLHGLPVWGIPLTRVHATRERGRSGGRLGHLVHVHCAPLADDEVVVVDGVRVTAPARTIVDVARTQPFAQAVVLADAALGRGLVRRAELGVALTLAVGWPGLPAARRAVAFADERSESVGESRSRIAIAAAGLPRPALQWQARTSSGELVARVDFGWSERRTVGEFDGRTKYGRLLTAGRSASDAVYEEKLREDRLRALGLAVIRWTWSDLDDFAPTAARLRAALGRT
jgi:hypothetical protein